jgi:hypothetical protein
MKLRDTLSVISLIFVAFILAALYLNGFRFTREATPTVTASAAEPTPTSSTELPPLKIKSGAAFGTIVLNSYDISIKNRVLAVNLYWQAAAPAAKNFKLFIHIFDPAQDKIMLQADVYPGVPTTKWAKDEIVTHAEAFALEKLPRGIYNVGVGWYDEASGQRLGDRAILNYAIVIP